MKAGSVSVVLGCAEGWGTELGALRGVMGCCELLRLCWWGGQRACCASSLLAVWMPQNTKQADPRGGDWTPVLLESPQKQGALRAVGCRRVPAWCTRQRGAGRGASLLSPINIREWD